MRIYKNGNGPKNIELKVKEGYDKKNRTVEHNMEGKGGENYGKHKREKKKQRERNAKRKTESDHVHFIVSSVVGIG